MALRRVTPLRQVLGGTAIEDRLQEGVPQALRSLREVLRPAPDRSAARSVPARDWSNAPRAPLGGAALLTLWLGGRPPPPPPHVLIGHAASLTPY